MPSSWRRNSASSNVKFRGSAGEKAQVLPQAPGYSQSTSMPSNRPAIDIPLSRSPLMNRPMQEATKARREAALDAASEKWDESVQPPSEMSTLSRGYAAFNFSN